MTRTSIIAALAIALLALPLHAAEQKPPPPKQADPETRAVFITLHGKRYHRKGCRYLGRSQKAITLKEARKRGYRACGRCGGG